MPYCIMAVRRILIPVCGGSSPSRATNKGIHMANGKKDVNIIQLEIKNVLIQRMENAMLVVNVNQYKENNLKDNVCL